MRSRRFHGVMGLVCLVIGFLVLWHALPIQAQGSAAAQGKPAFCDFGAKYCVPCKEMQKVVAELKPQYGDQVEFRLIYSDEEMPLFKQYKIVAIPTQVFLNAEGKEVDHHLGALSKEEVLKKLKELKFIR
ncbi:MAG: thioredoxin family protein [Desulfobaccales bacterium]